MTSHTPSQHVERRTAPAAAIARRRARVAVYKATSLLIGLGCLAAIAAAGPGLEAGGARITELLAKIPVIAAAVRLLSDLAGSAAAIERAAHFALGVGAVAVPFVLLQRIFFMVWEA